MISKIGKIPTPPASNLAALRTAQANGNFGHVMFPTPGNGHVGVVLGATMQGSLMQGSTGGICSGGPMQATMETKQPQDKVLRLVMARGDENYLITQCVIAFLGSLFTGFILGAYITSDADVVWWAVLPMIILSCGPMALVAYLLKQVFKRGEAKADLLNWPE